MLKSILKLRVKAQSATSGPPLGPALGQLGIPTMDFCKRFNDQSKNYKKGVLLNVLVYVNFDRSYQIHIKGTLLSNILKSILLVERGAIRSGHLESSNLLITAPMLLEVFFAFYFPKHSGLFCKSLLGSCYSNGLMLYCGGAVNLETKEVCIDDAS